MSYDHFEAQRPRQSVVDFEKAVDRLLPTHQDFVAKLCAREFCVKASAEMSDAEAISQRSNFERWLRMTRGIMEPSHPELINPILQQRNFEDFLRDAIAADLASRAFINAFRTVADYSIQMLAIAAKFGIDGTAFANYARYCADWANKVEENPVAAIYPVSKITLDAAALQKILNLPVSTRSNLDADTSSSRFCPAPTNVVRLDNLLSVNLTELKRRIETDEARVKENTDGEGSDESKKPKVGNGGDGMTKEAKAVAVLIDHPDWSNQKIAEAAGCHVKSLSRMSKFRSARSMQKSGKRERPLGRKDLNGDVEAEDK
jgi:hypothetical protein